MQLDPKTTRRLTTIFHLLATPVRLKICLHLAMEEAHVTMLTERLGRLAMVTVSYHLGLLRAGGVIECRRSGKHNYYGLVDDPLVLTILAACRDAYSTG